MPRAAGCRWHRAPAQNLRIPSPTAAISAVATAPVEGLVWLKRDNVLSLRIERLVRLFTPGIEEVPHRRRALVRRDRRC
jgi:hypothetical protein